MNTLIDKNFSYQQFRESIPKILFFEMFKNSVENSNLYLFQKKGILREWRAYWYLSKKYNWSIRISSTKEDFFGIDLISLNKNKVTILIQVGGFDKNKIKKCFCNYYCAVAKNKIYLYKIDK